MKKIKILGTQGIPARHGGFESFAEQLALYLIARDRQVSVYCQQNEGDKNSEALWRGVRLVHIPVKSRGPLGTIFFDWKSTLHASRDDGPLLTPGYNTAIFGLVYRLCGTVNLINMGGIELPAGLESILW